MSTRTSSKKRLRSSTPETVTHTDSIDMSSDLAFLIGCINSNNILLRPLLSSQITNLSFSDLYNKSQLVGWKRVLIELRNNLRLDEKSKLKRCVLNRLIDECSTKADTFNAEVKKLNEDMKKQLSNSITPEQACFGRLQTINNVYDEINQWRQLQCDRRLFYKEYNQRCSLLALQQCMTDHFINLIQAPYYNTEDFKQLFDHSLIIVVQPSGTDCFGVTRYEKIGDAFVTKIKTRIICLLDLNRIENYLQLSDVGVTLYLKDRKIDRGGDVQSSLSWKTRTIKDNDNEDRTFSYVELNENDMIKLTKKNSNGKLLYNGSLCQLAFQMKFKCIGINFETPIDLNSEYFGLCSHAKYSPKYLTKVFLEEVKKNPQADIDTHMNVLEKYIYEFHECISGVYAKPHTQAFIQEKLREVYEKFLLSAASHDGPVMFFSIDIYEDILEKFFSQIKFMGSHLFLSMMYFDSLFLGICTDNVDNLLNSNISTTPQLLMRFALTTEQDRPDNPNIIFAIHNNTLRKSRITHAYLVPDMSTCIYAATQNERNQIVIHGNDKTSPFCNFQRYYDPDLSRDNMIQTENETTYFPLNAILQNTIQTHPVQLLPLMNGQQNLMYTFDLSGQLTSYEDLTADAIAFLQEQLAHWCAERNIYGSLTRYSLENVDITDDDLTELFYEKNIL